MTRDCKSASSVSSTNNNNNATVSKPPSFRPNISSSSGRRNVNINKRRRQKQRQRNTASNISHDASLDKERRYQRDDDTEGVSTRNVTSHRGDEDEEPNYPSSMQQLCNDAFETNRQLQDILNLSGDEDEDNNAIGANDANTGRHESWMHNVGAGDYSPSRNRASSAIVEESYSPYSSDNSSDIMDPTESPRASTRRRRYPTSPVLSIASSTTTTFTNSATIHPPASTKQNNTPSNSYTTASNPFSCISAAELLKRHRKNKKAGNARSITGASSQNRGRNDPFIAPGSSSNDFISLPLYNDDDSDDDIQESTIAQPPSPLASRFGDGEMADSFPTSTTSNNNNHSNQRTSHHTDPDTKNDDPLHPESDPFDTPDSTVEEEHQQLIQKSLQEVYDATHVTVPISVPYHITVTNLVLSIHLSGGLDVPKLYTRIKNAELKTDEHLVFHFPTGYGRIVCTVYSTGKLNLTGSKTVKEALQVVRFIAAVAQKYKFVLNNYLDELQIRYARVNNVVVSIDLKESIRLDDLHRTLYEDLLQKGHEKQKINQGNLDSYSKDYLVHNVHYEPEVFSALRVGLPKHVVFQVFANGKIFGMGAAKLQQYYDYMDYLLPLMKRCMCEGVSEDNAIMIE